MIAWSDFLFLKCVHWKPRVVMMLILSVVITTTSSATCDDKVGIMTTQGFVKRPDLLIENRKLSDANFVVTGGSTSCYNLRCATIDDKVGILTTVNFPRWRHQMETFSALLTLCAWNSPVTGEFPSRRPVTRNFDVLFDLRLNKRLSKQLKSRWFETPSSSLWRHCNGENLPGLPVSSFQSPDRIAARLRVSKLPGYISSPFFIIRISRPCRISLRGLGVPRLESKGKGRPYSNQHC